MKYRTNSFRSTKQTVIHPAWYPCLLTLKIELNISFHDWTRLRWH